MSKKPDPVHLTFDGAAAQPRPAEAAALALEAARRSSAAEAAEAERRAFADTEPAFLDTITPANDEE
ncbi:hypothetical protein HLB44_10320 [Aquincola sp. S2]|uniref:Uncharacterized protein n=1 Tax=Pseudaquabacterium terrae TaxID=2732868 RepID=A0ABX2EFH8_9BURK|nr:hypothetical protein [Aquabacterium terrae]NRF67379.1 hypothetical protein [Aquabacterium terrae]